MSEIDYSWWIVVFTENPETKHEWHWKSQNLVEQKTKWANKKCKAMMIALLIVELSTLMRSLKVKQSINITTSIFWLLFVWVRRNRPNFCKVSPGCFNKTKHQPITYDRVFFLQNLVTVFFLQNLIRYLCIGPLTTLT